MDRKTRNDLLRGRNHPDGLRGAFGQRVSASLVNPTRPAKVPDAPRWLNLTTGRIRAPRGLSTGHATPDVILAQWWSEGPKPRSHWYVTTDRDHVLVTFDRDGEIRDLTTVV